MRHASVIVFADIAGSTALYEVLGNERAAEAVTLVVGAMARSIEAGGGRVVKTLGDGVLAVFADGAPARSATAALMRNHAQQMQDWPAEMGLEVRVGVAAGEIVEVDGDCYGDAVNLAARLCERARPCEVWFSASAVPELALAEEQRFVRLGTLAIRGKTEPIMVFGLEWRQDEDPEAQTVLTHLPSTFGPPPTEPAQLQVHWGDEGRVFGAGDMPLLLGRAPQSQVFVNDQRVSREHARIEWSRGAFALVDLSRFGTWLRFDGQEPLLLRRDSCLLHGSGAIALGVAFADSSAPVLRFQVSESGVFMR